MLAGKPHTHLCCNDVVLKLSVDTDSILLIAFSATKCIGTPFHKSELGVLTMD